MTLFATVRKGAWNVLVATDQWINAVLGGDPDETISSRAGKAMDRPDPPMWARFVTFLTDKLQPGHVHAAEELDEGKDAL